MGLANGVGSRDGDKVFDAHVGLKTNHHSSVGIQDCLAGKLVEVCMTMHIVLLPQVDLRLLSILLHYNDA